MKSPPYCTFRHRAYALPGAALSHPTCQAVISRVVAVRYVFADSMRRLPFEPKLHHPPPATAMFPEGHAQSIDVLEDRTHEVETERAVPISCDATAALSALLAWPASMA